MTAPDTGPPERRRIDRPQPGKFRVRLVKGGQWLPARIVSRASQPDRSPRLLCFIAGDEYPASEMWPSLHPVSDAEYERLLAATPSDLRAAVDLSTAAPMF